MAFNLRARLGEHDLEESTEEYAHEDYHVQKKIIHPYFNIWSFENDIALLKLTAPVKFRKHILPICLPEDDSDTFVGENATVSGWGALDFKNGSDPNLLQQVNVTVIENDLCESWMGEVGQRISDGMLCAGFKEGGKDACQGDSGGPLTLKRHGRNQLIGIVSWGYKCGSPYAPGVYTRVSKYVEWVRAETELDHSRNGRGTSPTFSDPVGTFISNSSHARG